MLLTFAGQQAIAKDRPRNYPQDRTFLVIVHAIDQNFGDEFGRIYQNHADSAELRTADARYLRAKLLYHGDPVAEDCAQNLNRTGH
jgi:hypothetical protein